jgi:hypothetical protein
MKFVITKGILGYKLYFTVSNNEYRYWDIYSSYCKAKRAGVSLLDNVYVKSSVLHDTCLLSSKEVASHR